MWRVSTCVFGLVCGSNFSSLQECLDEVKRQWCIVGIENMEWYRVEEFFDGKWYQRGFVKMDI